MTFSQYIFGISIYLLTFLVIARYIAKVILSKFRKLRLLYNPIIMFILMFSSIFAVTGLAGKQGPKFLNRYWLITIALAGLLGGIPVWIYNLHWNKK